MRLFTFLFFITSLACIFLLTAAEDSDVAGTEAGKESIQEGETAQGTESDEVKDQTPDTDSTSPDATDTQEQQGAAEETNPKDNSDTEKSDNEENSGSGGSGEGDDETEKDNKEETDDKEKEADEKSDDKTEPDKKKDDLNDNPEVVDPDSIADDTDARFHTVKLMLYIIAPVSALVVVYFIMKGLKGNSRMFLNRYHIVGARGDNIELRPLGYDSEDEEEDIVFDSTRHT